MTLSRVDLHSPQELAEEYVRALNDELRQIDERIELIRSEWMVLEDRKNTLKRTRTRHVEALHALTAPATLHALVDEPAEPDEPEPSTA
jgi:methionine synthase II (cobalamin-independent)